MTPRPAEREAGQEPPGGAVIPRPSGREAAREPRRSAVVRRPSWWSTATSARDTLLALAATPGPLPSVTASRLAAGADPTSLLDPHSPDPGEVAAHLNDLGARFVLPGDPGWPFAAAPPDPPCAWLFRTRPVRRSRRPSSAGAERRRCGGPPPDRSPWDSPALGSAWSAVARSASTPPPTAALWMLGATPWWCWAAAWTCPIRAGTSSCSAVSARRAGPCWPSTLPGRVHWPPTSCRGTA